LSKGRYLIVAMSFNQRAAPDGTLGCVRPFTLGFYTSRLAFVKPLRLDPKAFRDSMVAVCHHSAKVKQFYELVSVYQLQGSGISVYVENKLPRAIQIYTELHVSNMGISRGKSEADCTLVDIIPPQSAMIVCCCSPWRGGNAYTMNYKVDYAPSEALGHIPPVDPGDVFHHPFPLPR